MILIGWFWSRVALLCWFVHRPELQLNNYEELTLHSLEMFQHIETTTRKVETCCSWNDHSDKSRGAATSLNPRSWGPQAELQLLSHVLHLPQMSSRTQLPAASIVINLLMASIAPLREIWIDFLPNQCLLSQLCFRKHNMEPIFLSVI